MNNITKITMLCGAAAALVSGVAAVAQVAPPAQPGSPVHGYKHGEQRTDYLNKDAKVNNEWTSVRAKQHSETEMYHSQDAQLNAEELAYRKAHNGQLGAGIAARVDRDKEMDKMNELTAQHRATYKAQFENLRAGRQYQAQKERMQFKKK